jgi:uncharacterized membrane protein YkvA (DUF1232 family)
MRIFRFFRLLRAWRSFAAAFRMMRHPGVPLHLKLLAGGAALLILSPLNVLGDIPLLGLFDDVALLALLAGWFVGIASRYAAAVTLEGELVATRVDGTGLARV